MIQVEDRVQDVVIKCAKWFPGVALDERAKRLRDVFDTLDVDQDGTLDIEVWRARGN